MFKSKIKTAMSVLGFIGATAFAASSFALPAQSYRITFFDDNGSQVGLHVMTCSGNRTFIGTTTSNFTYTSAPCSPYEE